MKRDNLNIMIVAGEPSSDLHASSFVRALRSYVKELKVFGMGGSSLREAGVDTIVDSESHASVMGIFEVVSSLGKILKSYKLLLKTAKERKPDFVVLVDYPDFNLRLAKDLHKNGIKVFYFISPQIWAWRQKRVRIIKKYVDFVATIFPFEVDFYKKHGVKAAFVGHPFLDREEPKIKREEFLSSLGLNPLKPVICFLPGSRKSEISRLLFPMKESYELLKKDIKDLQVLLPVAPGLDIDEISRSINPENNPNIKVFKENAYLALKSANASVVASGTATIEAALAKNPFLVVYKLSPLTYRIAKVLVKGVKNFSMVNLVSKKKVVEELLQDEVTPLNISNELKRLILDKEFSNKMREELRKIEKELRVEDTKNITSAKRAALYALEMLE